MSSNLNNYQLSNEHLLLISILNNMYNDNINQINHLNNMTNNLIENNNQIRNIIIQLLNSNRYTNTNSSINNSNTNSSINNSNTYFRRRNNNSNRNINRNSNYNFTTTPFLVDAIYTTTIETTDISNNRIIRSTNNGNGNILNELLETFLQPVNIYPSITQIESATRQVRYCDIVTPMNTSCPISMEEFDDNDQVTVIRHCGHIFNTEHVMNWFRSNCRCPVCRYDIRDYSPNTPSDYYSERNT